MKKYIILALLILPITVRAAFTPVTWSGDFANQILQPLRTFWGATVRGNNFVATSTTATSTFAGGLTVDTSDFVVDPDASRVGIGTVSPLNSLDVSGTGARFTGSFNELTTSQGLYAGIITAPTIGFVQGGGESTWRLDNYLNEFRWLVAENPLFTMNTAGLFTAPNSSTTVASVTTLCLTSDLPCRTTWPTGTYPFTPTTNFGATNQATTGIVWFQNGLNASSTSRFDIVQLGTTTSSIFNGIITVDGVRYAKTGAGIQSAINDCSGMGTSTCSVVRVTPGTYTVSSKVTIPSYITLDLTGAKIFKSTTNGIGFENSDTSGGNTQITIVGGELDSGFTPTVKGSNEGFINFVRVTHSKIIRPYIHNSDTDGIKLLYSDNNEVIEPRLENLSGDGVFIARIPEIGQRAHSNIIREPRIYNTFDDGIDLQGDDNQVLGGIIDTTGEDGIYINSAATSSRIVGTEITNAVANGILISSSAGTNHIVNSVYFHDNEAGINVSQDNNTIIGSVFNSNTRGIIGGGTADSNNYIGNQFIDNVVSQATFSDTNRVAWGNTNISEVNQRGSFFTDYIRIGSETVPVNSTAGDLTVGRFNIGNGALSAGTGQHVKIEGDMTDTGSGSKVGFGETYTLDPASASVSGFQTHTISATIPTTNTSSFSTIDGLAIEVRNLGTSTITTTQGLTSTGLMIGTGSNYNSPSTTTSANAITAKPVNVSSGAATNTGGITTARGLLVNNSAVGSGPLLIDTQVGVDISVLTTGTTNIGVRIPTPTTGTTNYALQLSGTGGTAASGITFGTDTNLYRLAASKLNTDDTFVAPTIGVGTTSPYKLLSIEGASGQGGTTPVSMVLNSTTNSGGWTTGAVMEQILFDSSDTTGNGGTRAAIKTIIENSGGDDVGLGFFTTTGGAASVAEALRINHLGNIGIATTTPQWPLNPFSSSASQLSLSSGAGIAQWAFRNAGGNLYISTTTVAGTATTSLAALTVTNTGNFGISSTSPFATLSIRGNTGVIPFVISTTTTTAASTTLFMVDSGGWVHYGGGTPTLSSCGTGPTLDGNSTDQAGTVTFGASATGCTITFAQPAPTAPHCVVAPRAISLVNAYTVAPTTASIVITQAASGGTVWDYFCPLGH